MFDPPFQVDFRIFLQPGLCLSLPASSLHILCCAVLMLFPSWVERKFNGSWLFSSLRGLCLGLPPSVCIYFAARSLCSSHFLPSGISTIRGLSSRCSASGVEVSTPPRFRRIGPIESIVILYFPTRSVHIPCWGIHTLVPSWGSSNGRNAAVH